MLVFSCAIAEEVNAYYFDPAFVEDIDGSFAAIGEFGLMMYVPSNFVAVELSEDDIAKGAVAALAADDGSLGISISRAYVADAESNLISDFYASKGVTAMEIAYFNDLPALFYTLETPVSYNNLAFMTEEGCFIVFSFLPNGTEEMATLADILLFSVMPLVVEE